MTFATLKQAGTTAAPTLALNLPGTSGCTPFQALMAQPVQAPVSSTALDRLMTEKTAAVPLETLQAAHHAQQIEQHNAEIDKRNVRKRELKQLARKAGITVAALKRMMGRA